MLRRSTLVRSSSVAQEELNDDNEDVVLSHVYSFTTPVPLVGKEPVLETFPRGLLYVKLFCARNIRGDEYRGMGKADPYVKISYGIRGMQASLFSETHENAGSEPVWNHKFAFPVLYPEKKGRPLLELEIYNRNGMTRKDNKLGFLSVAHLAKYVTSKPAYITDENWFPVFDKKHRQRGEILMSLSFQTQGESKFADGWEIPNRLAIGDPMGEDQPAVKLRKFDDKVDGPYPPGTRGSPPYGEPEILVIE